MSGNKIKAIGIGVSLLITALNFIGDAISKKQEDERTKEICKDLMDERFGPVQEVEFEEIEEETEQTA